MIEKSHKKIPGQYDGGSLDKDTENILANLINSISKTPPAEAPRQYRRAGDYMDQRIQYNNNRVNVSSVSSQ